MNYSSDQMANLYHKIWDLPKADMDRCLYEFNGRDHSRVARHFNAELLWDLVCKLNKRVGYEQWICPNGCHTIALDPVLLDE